jgi:hypothetical protein
MGKEPQGTSSLRASSPTWISNLPPSFVGRITHSARNSVMLLVHEQAVLCGTGGHTYLQMDDHECDRARRGACGRHGSVSHD